MKSLISLGAGVVLAFFLGEALAQIPQRAQQYKRPLIKESRHVWGLDAPVSTFAAQIHQESLWRPDARSPYANGLAQFTPDTESWIDSLYGDYLGARDAFNPSWAIRALVKYNRHLWDRVQGADECQTMAFVLSAYNGGLGWVRRDKRIAEAVGDNPQIWFDSVEKHSRRARWAFKENRGYPRNILKRWGPMYEADFWGRRVVCN